MIKLLNVRIIPFVFLFFLTLWSSAQDIHFSQIHTVPLMLNPAATGIMESQFRLATNYRNQWRQIDFPYVSNYLSFDTRFHLLGRSLGLGAFLLHDQSSSLYLTADKIYISLDHSFYFRNHQLSIGIQPGWVLKSFDSRSISFGSQFDPGSDSFNPVLPSGESMLEDRMNYFDLNMGIFWRSRIRQVKYMSGVSVSHINRPVESFYVRNDSTRLPLKLMVHGSISLPLGNRFSLMPLYHFSNTSGTNELITGLITKYHPGHPELAIEDLFVVSQIRINAFDNADAVILGAGARFMSFSLCISYDFTVSGLRKVTGLQRAFEISLVYEIRKYKSERVTEPCYML
jgi:type IX secretion system PorP/SprF family membrane protein